LAADEHGRHRRETTQLNSRSNFSSRAAAQAVSGYSVGSEGGGWPRRRFSFWSRQCWLTALVAEWSQLWSEASCSTAIAAKYLTAFCCGFPRGCNSFAWTSTGISWAAKPRSLAAWSGSSRAGRRRTSSESKIFLAFDGLIIGLVFLLSCGLVAAREADDRVRARRDVLTQGNSLKTALGPGKNAEPLGPSRPLRLEDILKFVNSYGISR
jgi:hypothetical protein